MGPSTRFLVCFLVVLAAGTARAELPKQEPWTRVETDHFTLLTDGRARQAHNLGRELERLRGVLGIVSPAIGGESPRPTYVLLFGEMREFWLYHPDARANDYVSYSFPRERANYLTLSLKAGMDRLPILYRQVGHILLAQNLQKQPLWVREGLSAFFSRFRTGRKSIQVGLLDQHSVGLLHNRALMPLERLMEMSPSDPDYRNNQVRAVFDAESWGVVHYLITERDDRRQQFFAFIDLLRQGAEQGQAWQRAFGVAPQAVFAEFYGELKDRRFKYLDLGTSEEQDRRESRAEEAEMSWPETLYRLGSFALASDRPDFAAEHFRAALAAAPDAPWGHVGLGWAALEADRPEEAVAELRAAVTSGARLPEAWHGLGRALLDPLRDRQGWVDDWSAEDRKRLMEARAALEKSVELAPRRGSAWADLGATYFWDPRPTEGAQRMEEAFRLMPSRRDVALNLLSLYATLGWATKAEELTARGIQPISDAETLRRARELVARAREEAARIEAEAPSDGTPRSPDS